jgi:glutamate synthase domain-containing protein 2
MQRVFYQISGVVFFLLAILAIKWPAFLWLLLIVIPLFFLGIYDLYQKKHTILRNFPIVGHFRYFFELLRPEIQQYFIEDDLSGRPIDHEHRSVVYQRAKGVLDTQPFGTRKNVYQVGYQWINHSLTAKMLDNHDPRVIVGNLQCAQPYNASILNISAMSYGGVSKNAILALNRGAKLGNFYQNTGEGGISEYHLRYGGDLVWQIGTAYFGCRFAGGQFSPELFRTRSRLPNVKMIEIKLSQGAEPSLGAILPAVKLNAEIAQIRNIPLGKDVVSPPTHTAFSTPIEFMHFIALLRELSGGKPIGFKLCLGSHREFFAICKAMLATDIIPDFITIDGGEGGTGAAPLEFANSVGTPLMDAVVFIHNALIGIGLRDQIRLITAGKILTVFELVSQVAVGADMCNMARGMMMALGCIQSLKCNTNRCPTGVTTQDPGLVRGLVVEDKYQRVARFHQETVKGVMEMVGAVGLDRYDQLNAHHIYRRVSDAMVKSLDQIYSYIEPGSLLKEPLPEMYAANWRQASAESFYVKT